MGAGEVWGRWETGECIGSVSEWWEWENLGWGAQPM